MTGPRPSGRMRPSLRALPPRCLPLPRRVSFPGAGICRKTAKSTPLPQRIPSEGTTGDSCFLPGCEQTGECVRRRLRPGKSRPRRPENTVQAPRRTEERSAALNAVPLSFAPTASDRPRSLPPRRLRRTVRRKGGGSRTSAGPAAARPFRSRFRHSASGYPFFRHSGHRPYR